METKIIYPVMTKHKVEINAYGDKGWGEVNYHIRTKNGYKQFGDATYVKGYKDAIRDIRILNKETKNWEKELKGIYDLVLDDVPHEYQKRILKELDRLLKV